MFRILFILSALLVAAACVACVDNNVGDTPTQAYMRLYAAVKSKDIAAIKKNLTKKTIDFGAMAADRNKTPAEKMYENGFTATTFAETLPEIRDERVQENMGAVEVWNSRDSEWEDLPFMREDGVWKLAVGEVFAGIYKQPTQGRAIKEKIAANALNPPPAPQANTNNAAPAVRKQK
ncbi:MAG: hypothetical protein ABR530_08515 [Pyrinomonadaceae bacterium]